MRILLIEDDTVLGAAVRDQIAADGHSVDWVMRLDAARDAMAGAAFDLVLLDPPFDAGLLAPAVAAASPLLAPGGWLYVESGVPPAPVPAGLLPVKALQAGAVHAQLLRRAGDAPA